MIGTIVNVVAVLVGSMVGLFFNKSLPERFVKIFFQVMGIFTFFLGVSMALKSTHVSHLVMALITGSLIGEWLNLQKGMERFSVWIKNKIKLKNDKFTDGLLTAFLLYCVGIRPGNRGLFFNNTPFYFLRRNNFVGYVFW